MGTCWVFVGFFDYQQSLKTPEALQLQGFTAYCWSTMWTPYLLAKGPRSGQGKVACELCEKSYNSSRKEWYYDIKLHAVVARKPGCLPVPFSLMASGAAQHDLPAAKQIMQDHLSPRSGKLYADKAYADAGWAKSLKENHALELFTPRKKLKGDTLISGDTFSAFVSSIRQPIECFLIGSID